ncbi:MAG: type II secretion system F family protein [Gemmataceae bacterium]|nr:type II secretion system F family protein [Gemmataceae bacterium]
MSETNKGNGALRPEDLIYLNEEIAAMARAGLPLEQGLLALAREMSHGSLREVTESIAAEMRLGKTLPDAMALQGDRLPPFYSRLMQAGIRGGNLPSVLSVLTVYARSLADLRSVIMTALYYPLIVLLVVTGLFLVIFHLIMPQFAKIFQDFGMSLPWITEAALALGLQPMVYLVLPVVGILILFMAIRMILRSTDAGKCAWTKFVYSLPVVGTLIRSARLASFTELLSILVNHGMPLGEAFRLAGDCGSDPVLRAGAMEVEKHLNSGDTLAQALQKTEVLPHLVSWMAGIGEAQGKLPEAFTQASLLYRRQVEMRSAMVQSVVPPVLIVATAGIITFTFVLAIFLPLIKLLEGLSK